MTALPRIAALIGHGDELDMLERCIAHHARLGISHFLVSADAGALRSPDELAELEARENIRVLYRNENEDGFSFLTAARAVLAEWARPDWIVMLDSDEFCVCRSGDLRSAADLAGADIVQLYRFNVPLVRRADGSLRPLDLSGPGDVPLIRRPRHVDLHDLSETMWPPWIMAGLGARVMARPDAVESVRTGGHTVVPRAGASGSSFATDICVLHVPFTTFERFERKIERVRFAVESFGHLFKPHEALHWKRWAAIAQRGRLEVEFDRQILDEATFYALVADGTIVIVEQYFAAP